jgi:hypothetical protein
MPTLSVVCVCFAAAWLVLVVAAQVLTPGQSPLSMGLSGLATGRRGWVMKGAFVARGLSAGALAAALAGALSGFAAGAVLLLVWAAGSVLLAVYDTDMPGDAPSAHGRAHALIALVAYLAVAAATLALSPALRRSAADGGAWWAWPLAVAALVFLFLQFAAFAGQARAAAARPPARPSGLAAWAGLLQRVFIGLIMAWTVLAAVGL